MPQPPLDVKEYLSTPLPPLREQYPPGTGGTGPRAQWPEGTLKGVEVVKGFDKAAKEYIDSLSSDPIQPHPAHKYPKFVQAITTIPSVIKSPADLQKCLSTLPLSAISSVLTALEADEADITVGPTGAQALDKAGYESDGGEEVHTEVADDGKTKAWYWQYSKSPMGSGEFLLYQQGSDKVHLVVRTINSSAFTAHDWEEYDVTGPYRYNTASKASWYWSRAWGASRRLGCLHYVLTDWQRWTFGKFNEDRTHGWVSPVYPFNKTEPSVLAMLLFWARVSTGQAKFDPPAQDVSGLPQLFPNNPARRISVTGKKPRAPADPRKVKAANESDIEESDAEDAA